MSDPYFKKIYKQNMSNSADNIRERNQKSLSKQKVIDLLEGTNITQVKSFVNYEQPEFNLKQRCGN